MDEIDRNEQELKYKMVTDITMAETKLTVFKQPKSCRRCKRRAVQIRISAKESDVHMAQRDYSNCILLCPDAYHC